MPTEALGINGQLYFLHSLLSSYRITLVSGNHLLPYVSSIIITKVLREESQTNKNTPKVKLTKTHLKYKLEFRKGYSPHYSQYTKSVEGLTQNTSSAALIKVYTG